MPVAEDLTQETFLASVDELKKGRHPEAPIPWIYGIARHKLLDHYRKQPGAEQPLADAALASRGVLSRCRMTVVAASCCCASRSTRLAEDGTRALLSRRLHGGRGRR